MKRRTKLRERITTPNAAIVACLGSSSTAGKGQAFDWIGELERRPGNTRFRFYNLGVGGDLASNALRRLPVLLAYRPEKVVILVGGNDVLALVSSRVRRILRIWKRFPCEPSPEWYRENVRAIARRLKNQTSAKIGLCSLWPDRRRSGLCAPVPKGTQSAGRGVQRNH